MKTLVVHHDAVTRARLVRVLTRRGHEVDAGGDAARAWAAVEGESAALVLVDLALPGFDALAFCRALRARPGGDGAVLIALSPNADADAERAAVAGFDDVMAPGSSRRRVEARLAIAEQQAVRRQALVAQQADGAAALDLIRSEARFRSLIQHASDVVTIIDAAGTVVFQSPASERVLGYAAATQVGASVYAHLDRDDARRLREAIEALVPEAGGVRSIEVRHRHRDGSWRTLEVTATNLLHNDVGGIVLRARDVTERRVAEAALRLSEERLRLALEGARMATWDRDVASGWIAWSEGMGPLFGLPRGTPGLYRHEFLALLHPDDRQQVEQVSSAHVASPDARHHFQHRVRMPDGSWRWFETWGRAIERDADGWATRITGVTIDITERKEMEERLASERDLLQSIIDHIPDVVYVKDTASRFTRINRATARFLGLRDAAEAIGKTDFDYFPRALAEQYRADERWVIATGKPILNKLEAQSEDADNGTWFLTSTAPLFDRDGQVVGIIGSARDVTEQRRAEAQRRATEAQFRTLIEQIPAVTYVTTVEDGIETFLYVSPQIEAMLGYTPTEFLRLANPDWPELIHPEDRERAVTGITRSQAAGQPFRFEYRLRAKDGRWIWLRDEATTIPNSEGGPQRWQGVMVDLSERKAMEERLEHQAFHDALTNLPNRALLTERLKQALARGRRRGTSVAVLFLDVDNFKVVNDSLGHEIGDLLLIAVARRLSGIVRAEDTVARLGGDEFTVLLEDVAEPAEAMRVAKRIVRAFATPFQIGGREVYATTSIGIAVAERGQGRPLNLLRDADVAMYQAKRAGKGAVRVFDPALNDLVTKRLTLEQDLRRAIERGEFEVFYQPAVMAETGVPASVEALVRWRHPRRGCVPALEFIPLAEEVGLILPIGRWVMAEACRQARVWQERLRLDPPLTVSVNLSVRQFQHPDLVGDVARALGASWLDPRCLQLEITESVLVEDVEAALATLERLRSLGVRLALDDFGTGYSSLNHLKRLPVDVVKIDKSFIMGLGQDPRDAPIVQSIVSLGRTLGMAVAGEGVETAEQFAQLRRLGFALAQGYYFAPPLPAEEAGEVLQRLAADAGVHGCGLRGSEGVLASRSPNLELPIPLRHAFETVPAAGIQPRRSSWRSPVSR